MTPELSANTQVGDGGDAVRGEQVTRNDQESRSPGERAAASVTAMNIIIHSTFVRLGARSTMPDRELMRDGRWLV